MIGLYDVGFPVAAFYPKFRLIRRASRRPRRHPQARRSRRRRPERDRGGGEVSVSPGDRRPPFGESLVHFGGHGRSCRVSENFFPADRAVGPDEVIGRGSAFGHRMGDLANGGDFPEGRAPRNRQGPFDLSTKDAALPGESAGLSVLASPVPNAGFRLASTTSPSTLVFFTAPLVKPGSRTTFGSGGR